MHSGRQAGKWVEARLGWWTFDEEPAPNRTRRPADAFSLPGADDARKLIVSHGAYPCTALGQRWADSVGFSAWPQAAEVSLWGLGVMHFLY